MGETWVAGVIYVYVCLTAWVIVCCRLINSLYVEFPCR